MRRLIAILVTVALLAMFLMSCTRTIRSVERTDTVYVERRLADTLFVRQGASDSLVRVKSDTSYKTDVRHDTLTVRDSVFVRQANDTTYIYKERIKERVVNRRDTVLQVRTDTVVMLRRDTVAVYRSSVSGDSVSSVSVSSREEKPNPGKTWVICVAVLAAAEVLFLLWWGKRH